MRKKGQDKIIDIIFRIALIVVAIFALYPLWFIIIASFSNPNEVAAGNVLLWPKDISLDGYMELLKHPEILIGYRNSLFYLFAGSIASLVVILPAAYALSRRKLKGRRVLNFVFMIAMYFSGGIVPTYLLHSALGWLDTVWVLIIPNALVISHMVIARSAFDSIPEAIYESAAMDGATDLHFFFQFALPLVKATIAVLFLYGAVNWWNEYMKFVIYIREPGLQSLQVILREITSKLATLNTEGMSLEQIMYEQKVNDLMKYSLVVVAAIPFVIIYPFVQKYFNQGVMIGAVKG